tara:strand:- start:1967 stop:3004 length:1038 start_codon:yes stop_codon:yes gene_type:complete
MPTIEAQRDPDPERNNSGKNLEAALMQVAQRVITLEQSINDINQTMLSLAVHVQNMGTPTPVEDLKPWNPKYSNMFLWNKEENGVSWWNHYKGAKVFLLCGGPSLNGLDLSLLNNSGVITMGLNNSWFKFTPDMWIGFDIPGRFHMEGWMNPAVMKIVPWHRKDENLYDRSESGELEETDLTPVDAPNCWFLSNNVDFDEDNWHSENSVNWGGSVEGLKPESGYRVTILGALRTLYYLGFQEVYLLGCDWSMDSKEAYAWDEPRNEEFKKLNTEMYPWIEKVLEKLQPGFEESGFRIYNCNPQSKLKLYPYLPYEEAINRATIPDMIDTSGWYDVTKKSKEEENE